MSTKMNLPDAGTSRGGHIVPEGIATETFGREDDPEIYQKEIEESSFLTRNQTWAFCIGSMEF